jgi:hypothetical protein
MRTKGGIWKTGWMGKGRRIPIEWTNVKGEKGGKVMLWKGYQKEKVLMT